MEVNRRLRRRRQARHFHVSNHADNGMPGLFGSRSDTLAERIFVRKVSTHERPIHHRHWRRVLTIGILEKSALDQRNSHHREVSLAHHWISCEWARSLRRKRTSFDIE